MKGGFDFLLEVIPKKDLLVLRDTPNGCLQLMYSTLSHALHALAAQVWSAALLWLRDLVIVCQDFGFRSFWMSLLQLEGWVGTSVGLTG